MENQNTTPQSEAQVPAAPVVPATPQPVAPEPPAPTQSVKKSPKELINSLLEKYRSSSKNVKTLVMVGLAFLIIIFILLVAVIIKNSTSNGEVVAPSPSPTASSGSPLPEIQISNPSRYATDSGVLKIESDVDSLSKEMDSVDLRQSNLRVPTLDFNVKFQ